MYSNFDENNNINENTTNINIGIKKHIKTLVLMTTIVVGERYLNEVKYKKEKKEKIKINEKTKPNGYLYNIFDMVKKITINIYLMLI